MFRWIILFYILQLLYTFTTYKTIPYPFLWANIFNLLFHSFFYLLRKKSHKTFFCFYFMSGDKRMKLKFKKKFQELLVNLLLRHNNLTDDHNIHIYYLCFQCSTLINIRLLITAFQRFSVSKRFVSLGKN